MIKLFCLTLLAIVLVACETLPPEVQKYQQAISSWRQENRLAAVQFLKDALDINPEYFEAWMELGNYQSAQKNWKESVGAYESAGKLHDQEPGPWIALGENYIEIAKSLENEEERNKTFLTAQYNFSKALEIPNLSQDDKFRATLGKGICLLNRTLVEESRTYLQDALKMEPDNYSARFYEAAFREHEIGPNKKSLETYEKILIWKPDHLEALKQIGGLYAQLKKNTLAYDYYQKFLDNGGQSSAVKQWIAEHPITTPTASPTSMTPQPTYLMICPECGRIGKEGETVCNKDGANLVPREKS